MNVVQRARGSEPAAQPAAFFHPEALDVHDVMQIAEHEKAPDQAGAEGDQLIGQPDVQEMIGHQRAYQEKCCRYQPFESNVAQGHPVISGVFVIRGALVLQRSIDRKMMHHVTAAENADPAAVQQPVQPVPQHFGDEA